MSDEEDPMNRTVSTSHSQPTKLRLPKRILLVRHGQSLGNVDEEAYHTIPDWLIPITEIGENQARDMGQKIKALIGNEPIYIYYSPYLRTRQTMINMMEALQDNPIYGVREEPRMTEQQFGNFQNKEMENYKKEKNSFGRFYYRFPDGESGLDVYNRVTSFIGSLFREWYSHTSDEEFRDTNVIIVTHGLSLRLFIMRWFHFTVHQFEQSRNPDNGAMIVMERVTRKTERSPNISIPKPHNQHGSSGHLASDASGNSLAKQSTQIGLSVSYEEDDYILDLHPVSSYEKVELSRYAKNPHSRSGGIGAAYFNSFYGGSNAGNNASQHWYNTVSSKPHFPHRYSKENLLTADYDHHLEEENTLPQPNVDEFECFVLTKESQDLLQFHIPKKAKKADNTKYFRWKEYNSIYKLEEEIAEDVASLTICPRRRLAKTAAEMNLKKQMEEKQQRAASPVPPSSSSPNVSKPNNENANNCNSDPLSAHSPTSKKR